jgi:hypothetical protein
MPSLAAARSFSKSIKSVTLRAYHAARVGLQPYFSRFSRKDFTAPQLFALLVLRVMLKTDFRGLTAFLHDFPDVLNWLGLKRIPHYSTLCRAAQRLDKSFPVLLDQILVQACSEGFL